MMTKRVITMDRRWGKRARPLMITVGALAIAGVAYLVASQEPAPVPVAIYPGTMKPIGEVSDRYLSYNVEMVEVTGGRFWRPYKDGKRSGNDRYEYRPPLDLSEPRLNKLAAALGPAYVRFSGTWANATYFNPNATPEAKAPPGFDTVLTGEQWRGAVAFARGADAKIVTSFATSPGTRDQNGVWRSSEAERFVAYTKSLGAEIAAAEFANEPESVELTQAPKGYTPANYRRDYGRFHDWLRKASPSTRILAPGAAELGAPTDTLREWFSGMEVFDRKDLIAAGRHRPDAVSFHFYGGGSQRCGEIPFLKYGKDDALSDRWLSLIDKAIATTAALRDAVAPGAPLWLTETGETACGGNPWAATFTDTFRFTDQLARAAKQGVKVYIHNTLAASDYALLDEETFAPRPNYWAAWLWRKFMGTKVLDAGDGTTGLRVYAHCLRGQPGSVAVLAINHDKIEVRTLRIAQPGEMFVLQQGKTPAQATLNGTQLALGQGDSLPALRGVHLAPGPLRLQPATISYLAFPRATNPACRVG